jgi:hypothetical protein
VPGDVLTQEVGIDRGGVNGGDNNSLIVDDSIRAVIIAQYRYEALGADTASQQWQAHDK